MRSQFTWESAAATTVGNVRARNEDAILELPAVGLWAVADGMGGHSGGDIASQMVVQALAGVRDHERASALLDEVEDRLREVNDHLYLHSAADGNGISGTTVAVLLALQRHVISLWAGDSRVYRSRNGELAQLTCDHSDVQASNVITRAVGGAPQLFLDIRLTELQHRDQYLLCTDGLYKELSDQDLTQHLARFDVAQACQSLMKCALGGVCGDNVSAIVVEFEES
jgi:serine/threonine protein phosphatase Stp1